MILLGIETSCDDTSCAVVADGLKVLSNVVASQDEVHLGFGGIVPELASRRHLNVIDTVSKKALDMAGVSRVDAVAVTYGPGLAGSLLVGLSFAGALAYSSSMPVVPVNHLEGHILSAFLDGPGIPDGDFIALVVSGGHSNIYFCNGIGSYELLGKTIDDAPGEALDKAAKMLSLGYPGGPIIDRLASSGDPLAVSFPRPLKGRDGYDVSFSGLKTALYVFLQKNKNRYKLEDICASFQAAVVDCLVEKTRKVILQYGVKTLVVGGGVSANSLLRERLKETFKDIDIYFPLPRYCGDNGAMIASAGYYILKSGRKADDTLTPVPSAIL